MPAACRRSSQAVRQVLECSYRKWNGVIPDPVRLRTALAKMKSAINDVLPVCRMDRCPSSVKPSLGICFLNPGKRCTDTLPCYESGTVSPRQVIGRGRLARWRRRVISKCSGAVVQGE